VFLLVVVSLFGGIPAFIAWRRGGSGVRILATFLIGFVPYLGWVISWVLALTTKREKRCPQCAEGVRVEALVCPHCQHRFAGPSPSPTTP
jgi:hypothetical protein